MIINKIKARVLKLSQSAAIWSLLDQVVVSGSNFLLSILLARWLGLTGFGTFSWWYMLPLFLLSLHQAFISQPFQSRIHIRPAHRRKNYANKLWILQLVLAVTLLGLGIPFSIYLGDLMPLAACLLAVVVCLHDYLRKYCYALDLVSLPLIMDSVLYFAIFATSACLAYFQQTAMNIIFFSYATCYLLVIGIFSSWLKCYSTQWRMRDGYLISKEHYHFSFWLLGAALVQWIAGNGFILAAAAVIGPAALGGLRMAQQLVGICHVLFLALENTTPVVAAQYFYEKGFSGLKTYILSVSLRYGLAVGSILLFLAVFGPQLATSFYGAEYADYTPLIIAYTLLYIMVFLAIPLRIALRTIQRTKPVFIAYVWGAILSLLLAYPTVKAWGLSGAMLGLFLTQASGLFIYLQAWRRINANDCTLSLVSNGRIKAITSSVTSFKS